MPETLELISLDFWQSLMAIINLLILFLIVKKLLFKPVTNILDKREAEVKGIYSDAEGLKEEAQINKDTYEEKLRNTKAETDLMINNATERAKQRSEEIIKEATTEAENEKRKAEQDISLAKMKAIDDMNANVTEMVIDLAKQVIQKEVDPDIHKALIDSAIEELGESV